MKNHTVNNVWAVIYIAIVLTVFGVGLKMLRDSNMKGMTAEEWKEIHLAKDLSRKK